MNADDNLAQNGIAVVGMAGRFPGAANVDAFWENIKQGRNRSRIFRQMTLRSRP